MRRLVVLLHSPCEEPLTWCLPVRCITSGIALKRQKCLVKLIDFEWNNVSVYVPVNRGVQAVIISWQHVAFKEGGEIFARQSLGLSARQ